jgi:tetratricopeptide (TPR) repeat protein
MRLSAQLRAFSAVLLLFTSGLSGQTPIAFHARIVVEDGVPPPASPQIVPDPRGACAIRWLFGNGTVEYVTGLSPRHDRPQSDECKVTIRLPGYRKLETTLRNGAVVVLERLGTHSSPTVSLTTLKAPESARRAFEKGVGEASRKKWEAAQRDFERAVTLYADYAPAWTGLGAVLAAQSKPQESRAAWERAVKSDPAYAKAWVHLAHLAVEQGRNQDALDASAHAVQLSPSGYPEVYVDQAVASLALGRVTEAEESARRAVEIDTAHEVPDAEKTLGLALAAKGDRQGAIEHFQEYLKVAPKAADAAQIQQRIEELRSAAKPKS